MKKLFTFVFVFLFYFTFSQNKKIEAYLSYNVGFGIINSLNITQNLKNDNFPVMKNLNSHDGLGVNFRINNFIFYPSISYLSQKKYSSGTEDKRIVFNNNGINVSLMYKVFEKEYLGLFCGPQYSYSSNTILLEASKNVIDLNDISNSILSYSSKIHLYQNMLGLNLRLDFPDEALFPAFLDISYMYAINKTQWSSESAEIKNSPLEQTSTFSILAGFGLFKLTR